MAKVPATARLQAVARAVVGQDKLRDRWWPRLRLVEVPAEPRLHVVAQGEAKLQLVAKAPGSQGYGWPMGWLTKATVGQRAISQGYHWPRFQVAKLQATEATVGQGYGWPRLWLAEATVGQGSS